MGDEYKLYNYKNNRGFDIVIVDEIDCMMVDEYFHKTMLCTPMPFTENYSIICQLLWASYKYLNLDDKQVLLDIELKKKLKEYLIKITKNIINKTYGAFYYLVPMSEHERNFAFEQVNNWISSLISSLNIKKNIDYIIDENRKVAPVDYLNTGVIRKNTNYINGLNQFIQMQNYLPVTPISFETNYLSNLGLFQRYIKEESNNIFGMTGTLGSKETRDLLEKIYRLEFDYIPPNRMKILKELDCNLCFNHELMIQKIIFIVERETNGNRAILIICETIEIVNEIYEKLKNNLKNISLIKIIGENSEKNISSSKISSKTVIVSTNISGRGTDIKLDNEVLNNGGLHVLITFIPKNIRVEEQNYGMSRKERRTRNLAIGNKLSRSYY